MIEIFYFYAITYEKIIKQIVGLIRCVALAEMPPKIRKNEKPTFV